jgi:uncharacterized membrane protein HdeD (DUF308 family)
MVDQIGTADVRAATGGWWLLALVGVLSIAAGITILIKPGDSLATLAVIAGIFLLLDGILELAASLMGATTSRGSLALLGALTAIVGVLLIRHPIQGIAAIALLLGIWLIAVGVIRIIAAFGLLEHRGWALFAGAIELLAGIVIVSDPNIGFATLALFAGIAFIFNGIGMFALGWSLHTVRREAAAP